MFSFTDDGLASCLTGTGKVLGLVGDDETGDGGRGQCSKNTRDEGRDSQAGDVTATRGGELAENTNLDTERTDVAETAESVGGDESGSGSEVLIAILAAGEGGESVVLVLQGQGERSYHRKVKVKWKLTVMIFSAMSLETRRI